MDTILVVNAGSSSVKFQIFELANSGEPQRLIKGQVVGPDHPSVASALNNLASLYKEEARYADTEPPYKRARHGRTDQCCTREESSCQLGAVHTRPKADIGAPVRFEPPAVRQQALNQWTVDTDQQLIEFVRLGRTVETR
jgi:hypothetical protein